MEQQLSFFDGPRYTVLRLHPTRPDYYVLDESIATYVRLYGPPTGVPYTLREARDEAMFRNTALGSSQGTYDLPIRQASDEVLLQQDRDTLGCRAGPEGQTRRPLSLNERWEGLRRDERRAATAGIT